MFDQIHDTCNLRKYCYQWKIIQNQFLFFKCHVVISGHTVLWIGHQMYKLQSVVCPFFQSKYQLQLVLKLIII